MLAVMNEKNKKQGKAAYVDLLKITGKVFGYAHTAVATIKKDFTDPTMFPLLPTLSTMQILPSKLSARPSVVCCWVKVLRLWKRLYPSSHRLLARNAILRIYGGAEELHLDNFITHFSFQLKNNSYHELTLSRKPWCRYFFFRK